MKITSFGQGRVVINEFMAWSGCNTTSEFIELMNFGPGPMNIGCYIVTNGKYAVTIPPNTVVQPGQYYLISGQNILAKDCGNRDSAIAVDLNWTTCNCANTTIPTTGDGFLENGGSANEKIILLDPNLNVIDAVSRLTPASSSVSITTSSMAGACTSQTFNLSSMGIIYETIGESTGIDNSYSRKVDGDCGWVKTTQISAGAPNKTSSTSSAAYNFNAINTNNCNDTTGSISITVGTTSGSVSSFFPMNYIVARDADSNYIYNAFDVYTSGVDSSASNIDINGLVYGPHRITVASSLGCNLKTFDFFVFNCYTLLLPLKLISFQQVATKDEQYWFECQIANVDNLKNLTLEGSDGNIFRAVTSLNDPAAFNSSRLILKALASTYQYYRLRMTDKKDIVSYSRIISIKTGALTINRIWPNPSNNKINFKLKTDKDQVYQYSIYNLNNTVVKKGDLSVKKGNTETSISLSHLNTGLYQILLFSPGLLQPIAFRFVKQ